MYKVSFSLTSNNHKSNCVRNNPLFKGNISAVSLPVKNSEWQKDSFQLKNTSKTSSLNPPLKKLAAGINDLVDNVKTSTTDLVTSYANSVLNNFNLNKKTNNKKLEKELLQELQAEDKEQLRTAIALLGKLKSKPAIEKMVELLGKNSTDREIAAEIISALTNINNSKVIQAVIDVFENENKDEGLRSLAAISLGKMKNRRASRPLFEVLRNQDDSEIVRSHAALALCEFPTIRNTEQLVISLNDPSALVRANAVLALGIINHTDAIPQIIRLLQDDSTEVKSNAVLTLGNLKAKNAVDDLIKALDETNSDVVISIARTLKFIDDEKTTTKLVSLLEDSSNHIIIRRNAAACLQLIQDKESIKSLNKLLADKNEDLILRNYVLSALVNMKAKDSLPSLISILDDSNENFQLKINAAAGIGLLGSEKHLNSLINTANNAEAIELKGNCLNAIRNIASRSENKSLISVDKLIPFLNDENEKVRALTADTLGIIKATQTVKKLLKHATNDKEHLLVRAYCIDALGKMGDKTVVNTLLDILKTSNDHRLASRAAAAIYNLGEKKELFNLVNSSSTSFEIKNHAAGVLISRGEKSKELESFLQPGLNVKKLHEQDIKGQGIAVAVIDDTVDPDHPEFSDRVIIEPLEYHGTLVSGNLGGNISGVAPKVIIHSYNAFANKNIDQILEKIVDQKINGENDIKVVNISLGFNSKLMTDPSVQKIVERFDQVAQMAKRLGITVVVASGNDGKDMPIPGLGTLNLLCLSDHIISVGATNPNGTPDDPSDDTRAEFSSYPAEDSPRQLDVMAPGFEVTLPNAGGSYKTVDGTSFASPFVAGLVALMYQVNPDITPAKVKEILKQTATKLNNVPDYMQGSGVVSPLMAVYKALKLVNSQKATELATKLNLQNKLTSKQTNLFDKVA